MTNAQEGGNPSNELERLRARVRLLEDRERETAIRLGNQLHEQRADLIGELLQNAEDAAVPGHPCHVGFEIHSGGLLVWNNGRPFTDRDLEAIGSLWDSTKALDQAGYFGIGFKSVLRVTNEPFIASRGQLYRLPSGVQPEVWGGPMPPAMAAHVAAQRTCFWLPWRQSINIQEVAVELHSRFVESAPRLLLFLDAVSEIEFSHQTTRVVFRATRTPGDHGIDEVRIEDSENRSSTWLRFSSVRPLEPSILDLMIQRAAEQSPAQAHRLEVERTRSNPMKIQFAFQKTGDGLLEPVGGIVFSRIPTKQGTGLQFHVNARFPTNLARDHIVSEDPLASWLLDEAATAIPLLIKSLVRTGFLIGRTWACFPAKDEVKGDFLNLANILRTALAQGTYFANDAGSLERGAHVRLAHNAQLYSILGEADLVKAAGGPGVRWIHESLRGKSRERQVVESLGVQTIEAPAILDFFATPDALALLEKKGGNGWLLKAYGYLQAIGQSHVDRIADMRIVPLEDGSWVTPSEAILPPMIDSVDHELRRELSKLPFVRADIAGNPVAVPWLKSLGTNEFDVAHVFDFIFGRYADGLPSPEVNLQQVRMLQRLHRAGQVAPATLSRWRQLPILQTQSGAFVSPESCYLSLHYGGNAALPFFFMAGERPRPFVATSYEEENAPSWKVFLLAMGVNELPLITCKNESITFDQAKQRFAAQGLAAPGGIIASVQWKEWQIDGLSEFVSRCEDSALSKETRVACWNLVVQLDEYLDPTRRLAFGETISLREARYVTLSKTGRALSYSCRPTWSSSLANKSWLLDSKSGLAPAKALSKENLAEIFGEDARYLHPDFPLGDRHEWLAKVLGIRLATTVQALLEYILELGKAKAAADRVKAVYKALLALVQKETDSERAKLEQFFASTRSILGPEGVWYYSREVCWTDPAGVLPSLRQVWGGKESFERLFTVYGGVREEPGLADYIEHLQRLSRVATSDAIASARKLYKKLEQAAADEENLDALRALRNEPIWLARLGQDSAFVGAGELALDDHTSRARLFDGKLPLWDIKSSTRLVDLLDVTRLSQASPFIQAYHQASPHEKLQQRLAEIWNPIWQLLGSERTVSATAPEVLRVIDLDIRYRLSLESIHYTSERDLEAKAVLDRRNWNLFVAQDLDEADCPWVVGAALQSGLALDRLSEVTKDFWYVPSSSWGKLQTRWLHEMPTWRSQDDRTAEAPDARSAVAEGIGLDVAPAEQGLAAAGDEVRFAGTGAASPATAANLPRERESRLPPEEHDQSADLPTWAPQCVPRDSAGSSNWPVDLTDRQVTGGTQTGPELRQISAGDRQGSFGLGGGGSPSADQYHDPDSRFSHAERVKIGQWGEEYAHLQLAKSYAETHSGRIVSEAPGECVLLCDDGREIQLRWLNAVSDETIGHDIEVKWPDRVEYIEVKSTSSGGPVVVWLSDAQWKKANAEGQNFVLACVTRAGSRTEARCLFLRDPARKAATGEIQVRFEKVRLSVSMPGTGQPAKSN